MSDEKPDQRKGDRRKGPDPDYTGPERRKGDRRAAAPPKDEPS